MPPDAIAMAAGIVVETWSQLDMANEFLPIFASLFKFVCDFFSFDCRKFESILSQEIRGIPNDHEWSPLLKAPNLALSAAGLSSNQLESRVLVLHWNALSA